MKRLWNKILKLPKWSLFLILGLILALVLLMRSCSAITGQEHVYSILRSNNWAPLDLYGKEPNMSAFVDDLIGYIAQEEHLRIRMNVIQVMSGRELFHYLDVGGYDAIVVTFSPSNYVVDKYNISDPIYKAGPVLLVKADNKAASIKELLGKPIAIIRGSSQMSIPERETAFFVPYDNMAAALDDLEKNIVSGVIMEAGLAEIYVNDFYKGKIRIATPPLTDLAMRLVTRKGDLDKVLVDKFNEGLKTAKENGTFEQLIHKWNLVGR